MVLTSLNSTTLKEEKYVRTIGEFFQPYEHKYWWWHAVVILRRFVFVLTAATLSSIGYFQVLSLARSLALSLALSLPLRRLILVVTAVTLSSIGYLQVLVSISVCSISSLLSVLLLPVCVCYLRVFSSGTCFCPCVCVMCAYADRAHAFKFWSQ